MSAGWLDTATSDLSCPWPRGRRGPQNVWNRLGYTVRVVVGSTGRFRSNPILIPDHLGPDLREGFGSRFRSRISQRVPTARIEEMLVEGTTPLSRLPPGPFKA
jgi:hypothetical protein